jgi:hypothetical protein
VVVVVVVVPPSSTLYEWVARLRRYQHVCRHPVDVMGVLSAYDGEGLKRSHLLSPTLFRTDLIRGHPLSKSKSSRFQPYPSSNPTIDKTEYDARIHRKEEREV